MTTARLAARRAVHSAQVLAALAGVVLVSTLALTIVLGLVTAGVASGSRSVLENAAPRSAAVQLTTHLADDPLAQSTAASAMFARLFGPRNATVTESWRSLPVTVREIMDAAPSAPTTAVVAVVADLPQHVTVAAGAWPSAGTGAVAVQADAASALGLAVGDTVVLGSETTRVRLTVAALWRATDPQAPRWFADPLVAGQFVSGASASTGAAATQAGLFVVTPETALALPTQLFVSWTVTPTARGIADFGRAKLAGGIAALSATADAEPNVVSESADTVGTLGETLARIDTAGRGATAIGASAACIVAVLSVVALLQLCGVLGGARRRHGELLRARGLSVAQLVWLTALEAVAVAAPAAAIGALGASLALGTSVPLALLAAAGVVGAAVACQLSAVLLGLRSARADAPPPRSPALFLALAAGLTVAAALAVWQLISRGTPVAQGQGQSADVVAAVSAALALVAGATLGTALLVPVASANARRLERRGRVTSVLASRTVARRTTRYLAPVLALAIAAAAGTFASGIAATRDGTEHAASVAALGADVSVSLVTDDTDQSATDPVTSAAFAGIDGVRSARSLVVTTATIGSDVIPVVAVRSPASANAGGFTLTTAATVIAATVTATGGGSTDQFDAALWFADRDGSLAKVPLARTDGSDVRVGTMPPGPSWRLVAAEALRSGFSGVQSLEISGVTADGTLLDVDPLAVPVSTSRPLTRTLVRTDAPDLLPVTITEALADRLGVTVGADLTLVLDPSGESYDARIASVTESVAGAGSRLAIGADLEALDAASLRSGHTPVLATDVWITTGTPNAVARTVAASSPTVAIVHTARSESSAPVVDAAYTAFWLAAVAAALLALFALAAFLSDDARRRRGEVAVLRALGLSPAEQGTVRAHELRIVLAVAAGAGILAGLLAAALTASPFAAAAVPGANLLVTIVPAFAPAAALVFVGALGLGASVIAAVSVARARRTAARPGDIE